MFGCLFKKSFDSVKCKTLLRLSTSRIKLLRNEREVQLKKLKRELAKMLETNQEPSAHIQVEHIYREQNSLAAYDVILLFCELLAARLPIIQSQRHCPIDLREAIASIIFAAPRCLDVPELQKIRSLFTTKYGKEFTIIAAELRPDCGVNRVVVEKLSVKAPSMEVKLKLMKDIATEQGLDWDITHLASQNLKPPEDLLDGQSRFFVESRMPVQESCKEPSFTNKPIAPQQQRNVVAEAKTPKKHETPVVQNMGFLDEKQFLPFVPPIVVDNFSSSDSQSKTMQQRSRILNYSSHCLSANDSLHSFSATSSNKHDKDDDSCALDRRMSLKVVSVTAHKYDEDGDLEHVLDRRMSLKGIATAARAAAQSAENAAAAAREAALLASQKLNRNVGGSSPDSESNDGEEASQLHERFEDNHLNPGRLPPDDSSTLRMPFFDEPVEVKGFHRVHSSEKNVWSYEESRGELSESIFSRESYNFDDTKPRLRSTTSPERCANDQTSRQQLDHSVSSSNNWGYQHNTTKFSKTRSFATAGAASSSDTLEWDDPGNKPIDEGPQSRPPERPSLQLAGVQPLTLTKSISFTHPKLPDYDKLTAHFQALKAMRSREK